jgi:hypothetical protein
MPWTLTTLRSTPPDPVGREQIEAIVPSADAEKIGEV